MTTDDIRQQFEDAETFRRAADDKQAQAQRALIEACVALGYNQTDLARFCKTDKSNISKMRSGSRPMPKEARRVLMSILEGEQS